MVGRPKLHSFPVLTMLQAIGNAIQADRTALEATIAANQDQRVSEQLHRWFAATRELKHLADWGVHYDIVRFIGFTPTASARIAAQKSIRQLESEGLLELFGRKATDVRLTPAGWAKLAESQPPQPVVQAASP